MVELGYALSSEEHAPQALIESARAAEAAGFGFAFIAQAAATTATLMPGRFILGVGTGENLNEHILGDRWPSEIETRLRMLEEAVDVIRTLWEGSYQSYEGEFYTVDNARIYTLPE